MVPSTVNKCRTDGTGITTKARNETIRNSLVILQAHIGRDRPTNAEFEICAQKMVDMVPELGDPLPQKRKDAFKQWVSFYSFSSLGTLQS